MDAKSLRGVNMGRKSVVVPLRRTGRGADGGHRAACAHREMLDDEQPPEGLPLLEVFLCPILRVGVGRPSCHDAEDGVLGCDAS